MEGWKETRNRYEMEKDRRRGEIEEMRDGEKERDERAEAERMSG
jgi:hypothetical protein